MMFNQDSIDYDDKISIIDNLCQFYTINHNLLIEHGKKITVENRPVQTTVISGLFESGMIVYTSSVDVWIKENKNPNEAKYRQKWILYCLLRHFSGDWGKLCDMDALTNELALDPDEPQRIMSVYQFEDKTEFWIITEWNREVTTVLFPTDY